MQSLYFVKHGGKAERALLEPVIWAPRSVMVGAESPGIPYPLSTFVELEPLADWIGVPIVPFLQYATQPVASDLLVAFCGTQKKNFELRREANLTGNIHFQAKEAQCYDEEFKSSCELPQMKQVPSLAVQMRVGVGPFPCLNKHPDFDRFLVEVAEHWRFQERFYHIVEEFKPERIEGAYIAVHWRREVISGFNARTDPIKLGAIINRIVEERKQGIVSEQGRIQESLPSDSSISRGKGRTLFEQSKGKGPSKEEKKREEKERRPKEKLPEYTAVFLVTDFDSLEHVDELQEVVNLPIIRYLPTPNALDDMVVEMILCTKADYFLGSFRIKRWADQISKFTTLVMHAREAEGKVDSSEYQCWRDQC